MRKLILLLILLPVFCFADEKVSGEYTYVCSKEVSLARAEQIAIQKAREQALANRYGVSVQQIEGSDMRDGKINISSQSIHRTHGVWIKDTRKPKCTVNIEDNLIAVTAKVWGTARKLSYEGPEFDVSLLRNVADKRHSTNEFIDGGRLFLSFTSAVDGYLAVYARDDSVRLLIPKVDEESGLQTVKANQQQLFFTGSENKIVARTDKEVEATTIYVLFSPEKIIRPLVKRVDEGGLPVYSVDEFFALLNKQQSADHKLQIQSIEAIIRNE